MLVLVVGCTPVRATGSDDAGAPAGEPVEWSTAELGSLPPVGVGGPAPRAAARMPPFAGLVAIRTDGAVLRVRDGRVDVDEHPGTGWGTAGGIVGLDGRTLVDVVSRDTGTTEVHWADVFTGEKLSHAVLAGSHLVPTVTDTNGQFVALVTEGDERLDGAISPGRRSSTIVIADRDGGEQYRTTLDGNYYPEAFGNSIGPAGIPDAVYLLEYLPADAPTHYRVRVLQTSTGEIGLPVNLRDKSRQVDATMAGISRTQVVSGHAGGLVFTLYRGVAGEGDRHGYAFVHTLGLAGGVWCLDIAPEMELDIEPGALAVAGDRLVVASANGTVGSYAIGAVLDPAREPVMDVVTQYLQPDGQPVLAATGDRLWVAWANFVYELDPVTLEMVTSAPRQLAQPVTAMAATVDGLLVAHTDGTVVASDGTSIDLTPKLAGADPQFGIVALLAAG
jgi:hypothetical protein